MPSLFLGRIAGGNKVYEIHALTKDLPFREYRTSEISDSDMFQKLIDFNDDMIGRMNKLLHSDDVKSDSDLIQAIQIQTVGIQIYNNALLDSFEFLKSKLREIDE